MKDVILVVAALVVVALSVLSVRMNEKATKFSKGLEEERYSRLVAEESVQKSAAKIVALSSELKSAQGKMAKVQAILDQEQNVNADLKAQFDRLAQAKSQLEEKLNTALKEADQQPKQKEEPVAEVPVKSEEPVASEPAEAAVQ